MLFIIYAIEPFSQQRSHLAINVFINYRLFIIRATPPYINDMFFHFSRDNFFKVQKQLVNMTFFTQFIQGNDGAHLHVIDITYMFY